MKYEKIIAIIFSAFIYSNTAIAGLITGPVLTNDNTGWVNNGLSFTALQDSTLTSFVYNNQGLADTVLLVDEFGNIIQSFAVAGGNTQQLINVSWPLLSGKIYGLIVTQEFGNNGRWSNASFPVANSDISINGYANNGLGVVAGTNWWFHFNDIATSSVASVSEPSPFALFSLCLAGMILYRTKEA